MTDAEWGWEELKKNLRRPTARDTAPVGSIDIIIEYCESLREELTSFAERANDEQQQLIDTIEALEEAQRWRSVEDELPEEERHHEVYIRPPSSKGWWDIAFWDGGKWDMGEAFVFSDPNDYITHWMPLPAPPEGA